MSTDMVAVLLVFVGVLFGIHIYVTMESANKIISALEQLNKRQ